MPELPEVETIRRGLEPAITGQIISDVEVIFNKSFNVETEQIAAHVAGQVVKSVTRRGKVLIINLDNEHSLLIHLKMTGQLVLDHAGQEQALSPKRSPAPAFGLVRGHELLNNVKSRGNLVALRKTRSQNPKSKTSEGLEFRDSDLEFSKTRRFAGGHPTKSMVNELPDNSTRVVFVFDNGYKLFFNDQRKFGWIKLVPTNEVELDLLIARLGPEPLEPTFELDYFIQVVKRRKAPIKAVLLDQSTLAGLGNIYVDEALHMSKTHPETIASKISKAKLVNLHESIIKVLKKSLEYGGTSFTNYVNALGVKGNYLENARVFKREGQPCPECGAAVEKIRVAGRGTHFCPKCQEL